MPCYPRWIIVLLAIGATGCERAQAPEPPVKAPESPFAFQAPLPFQGSPLDILTEDLDADGRLDIAAVSHAFNFGQIFFQKAPRQYTPGPRIDRVGFHPGDWLRWPGEAPVFLSASEGEGALINFKVDAAGTMEELSRLPVRAPRHIARFNWPGWGNSLAVTPFEAGALILLKGYDAQTGRSAAKYTVNLGEDGPSIRMVDRVAVADMDGDGIDELLFASRTTGEVFKVAAPRNDAPPKPEVLLTIEGDSAPHQVLPADLNHDGRVDLLVPDQIDPFQINLYLNQLGGGLVKSQVSLPFPKRQGIRYADFGWDQDGMGYLMVVGYGAVAIYQFPGAWQEPMPVAMRFINVGLGGMSSDIVMRDLDGDGWLDVVVGYASGEHGVWVLHGPLWEHMETLAKGNFILN